MTATGANPLQYQWFFNGGAMAGKTASDLLLTSVQTNNGGNYHVVVSDVSGATTSSVAPLVVRYPNDPVYSVPVGGWTYMYAGNAASNAGPNALDGTWNHDNGSDSWSGDGRGAGAGLLGGIGSTNGILTIEDAIVSGASSVDNRRYYLTHDLSGELPALTADSILNNGVTLSFRARLTPSPPADPLTELTNAPSGFVNVLDGKGMFGIRQAGANGLLISFSLHEAIEDTSSSTTFNFNQAGLHMNNLNGDVRATQVDPGEGGILNVLPLDPAVFHEFWITIVDNGTTAGTHRVSVYTDGITTPTVFNVTAGTGVDGPYTNYLALGMPSTGQRGAYDIDFFGYKTGVIVPAGLLDPAQIVLAPSNQVVNPGQPATFSVDATGTPPLAYQWYRNGLALPGATNATHTTPATTASDEGAQFVVTVSNLCGVVTSAPPAVLTLQSPPTITSQPVDLLITNGSPASFSVSASGAPPITYQWRFNNTALPNETNTTLSIVSAGPAQAGNYSVVVANPGGSITSRVAVLTVRVLDFGDAPAPYPTLRSAGGAYHVVVSGIYLGAGIDFELDGYPEPFAQGDDLSDSDDEDGVTFTSPLRQGQLGNVAVVASTQGVLNAWIDFDRNGSWSGPGEQVFTNTTLLPGTNQLTFMVPVTVSSGDTFARFRFATTTGIGPTGGAADGEVEDYRVTLVSIADIGATMSDSPDPAGVGSNLVYAIIVTNRGPSQATSVTLVDPLPANLSYVSAISSIGACGQATGTVTCFLGTLASGGSATVTIRVTPNAPGSATNSITISATEADLQLADNIIVALTTIEAPPVITSQPVSLVVTQGNTSVFSVSVDGTPPLSYQWQFQGVSLSGKTNAALSLPNTQTTNAGTYAVLVSNRVGQVTSAPATLTVLVPPSISQQPLGSTNTAGSSTLLSVTAAGTLPLSYQWYFNNGALAGAIGPTLPLNNLQTSNTGNYFVIVSNSAGSITSAIARVTVIELDFGDAPAPYPTLLASDGARHIPKTGVYLGTRLDFEPDGQPSSTALGDDSNGTADEDGVVFLNTLFAGQVAQISVVASTNGVLSAWVDFAANGTWSDAGDQILTNRTVLAGTNLLSFQVPATAATGLTFGRFRFSTTGGLGVTGEAPDGEVEDYAVQIVPAAQLALSLTGGPPVTAVGSNIIYQIAITNFGPSIANNVILSNQLPNAATFISGVSSAGGCINQSSLVICDLGTLGRSNGVTVSITATVGAPGALTNVAWVAATEQDLSPGDNSATLLTEAEVFPDVLEQPTSQTITNGGTAQFTVTANGTSLRYQWSFNGAPLASATNADLTIPNAQPGHAGTYVVTISNRVGAVSSAAAQLTVLTGPVITTQPQSKVVIAGSNTSFTVQASGSAPLFYQWLKNGSALNGAALPTLTISNSQPQHEGTYTVVVSNIVGAVTSQPVTLTVLMPPQIVAQSQSSTNFAGNPVMLNVTATGTEPLTYRWFYNQTNQIPGANSTTLVIPNAQRSNSGSYNIVVTNVAGTVIGQSIQVTVFEGDFGDAPKIGYPTLLSFNGARHVIVPGIYLGSRVDFEPDGIPSATANGDDSSNLPDEDGVTFSPLLPGQPALLSVVASTNGFIGAWFDFNQNGTWSEPGEQVLASLPVVAGTNVLSFTVPAMASLGDTFARIRFSTVAGLSFDGPAPDGEVEDYLVTIVPAVDLGVSQTDQPDPAPVNGMLTYAIIVTNRGPSTASAVSLNDLLPPATLFVSVSTSQGSCTNIGDTMSCDLGALAAYEQAFVALTVTPLRIGMFTNRVSVSTPERDVIMANNTSIEMTAAAEPTALFGNATSINMPDLAVADPYPSTIFVSGVTATVQKVIVVLSNLTHTAPADLDILLVGPRGQSVVLMSDAGARPGVDNVRITFDDSSSLSLPESGGFASETYRPTNLGTNADVFPPPAPAGPYSNTLAVFRGTDPNGTWSLYVVDDELADIGYIAGGWGITFLTLEPFADVTVTQSTDPPLAVPLGSNFTYTITVTNQGPADVTNVRVTDQLPATFTPLAVVPAQGQCTNNSRFIDCALGNLPFGQSIPVVVTGFATSLGVLTNDASVTASELDFVVTNNTSHSQLLVKLVNDLILTTQATPEPVLVGQQLTYTLIVSNAGPNPATDVLLRHELPAAVTFASAATTQGACTNNGGVVQCPLGTINSGGRATIVVRATPQQVGIANAHTTASAYEIDLVPGNNEAFPVTTIGDLPRFTSQPPGQTVPVLSNVTFSVSATGVEPISYQWFLNGVPLPAATTTSLPILSVRPVHAGFYTVLASNRFGSVTTVPAELRVDYSGYRQETIPLISRLDGWRYDTNGIDLGTNWQQTTFNDGSWPEGQPLFGLESSVPYPYPDVIRTPFDLLTTNEEYILTYYFRTRFTFHSTGAVIGLVSSNLVDDGAAFYLNSKRIGEVRMPTGPVSYSTPAQGLTVEGLYDVLQWAPFQLLEGTNVLAAEVHQNIPGSSDIVFGSTLHAITVPVADLALRHTAAPSPVGVGSNLVLVTTISNAGPAGATTLRFRQSWIGSANFGSATVTAGSCNFDGTNVNCAIASLAVGQTEQVTVTVVSTNSGTLTSSVSVAAAELDLETADNNGSATVVMGDPPAITGGPLGQTVTNGIPVLLSANITGTQPLSLQWLKNGNELPGATNTSLLITNIQLSDAGDYRIRASNHIGVALSDIATVRVLVRPTISLIANQITDEDILLGPLPFTVADFETASVDLSLSVTSSDSVLIPLSNIHLAGPAADRTITVLPAPDRFGTSIVSITVQDRDGISATSTFSVNVRPVNDAPTLAGLPDLTIRSRESGPVAPRTVALSNITSGAFNENDDLFVTASNDNPGLFTAFTVEYSSPSTTGLLRFTPTASTNGSAIVSVTVDDRQSTNNRVTRSFVLTVKPPLSLQITRVGSLVTMSFDTITSESYTLEYKNSFLDVSWTPLGSARAGTGSTLTVTDDIADASRLYRVRIE